MRDFETMNQMVYNGDQRPDDLCLPEQVAWDGLEYVYGILAFGRRSRDECAVIKSQIGREYQKYVDRFEKLDQDISDALAVWKAAVKSDDPAIKEFVHSVIGSGSTGTGR